jgi:hypothetical protein
MALFDLYQSASNVIEEIEDTQERLSALKKLDTTIYRTDKAISRTTAHLLFLYYRFYYIQQIFTIEIHKKKSPYHPKSC